MIRTFLFLWVVLLPFLSQAQQAAFAQPSSIFSKLTQEPQFLPVEQAFVVDFREEENHLKLSFSIKDGYYLYKDKFKFAGVNAKIQSPHFPAGRFIEDEYFGESEVYFHQVLLSIPVSDLGEGALVKVRYQGCAEAGLCYPPHTLELPLSQALLQKAQPDSTSLSIKEASKGPISEQLQLLDKLQNEHLITTLALFFLLGLGLAFTPCVFPMYPILTSIIVGQGQALSGKRAFSLSMAYVQGMAISYSLLGLLVASLGLQFQTYFQHPLVLGAISLLFIVLALSMFGVFNVSLPSRWLGKITQLSNKQQSGSHKGALIMGMLSGLVASPCTTAPLTAALLYVAQSGDLALGALTLYILSLGMGLPLLILGSTGGKFLPKAGAWMNSIKIIFAFLLLAVPIWLLSRFVPFALTLLLSSLLSLMLAVYLHTLSRTVRQALAQSTCYVLALCLMMATVSLNVRYWLPTTASSLNTPSLASGSFHTLKSLSELQQAIKNAATQNKPVLVDLYADWCVACKEFEHITFANPDVQRVMAQFVLLKVDVTAMTKADQELLDHYQVIGLPTLLLFDKTGEEVKQSRITGFMGPQDFQQHLTALLGL